MVVLPAPDGPTSATSCARFGRERDVEEHLLRHLRIQHRRPTPARPATPLRPTGSGSPHCGTRSTAPARGSSATASGLSTIAGGRSSTSKTRSNDDQRRHDVDPHIGQRRERPVEPAEIRGQRDERAHLQRALGRQPATDPVRDRRGQRRHQAQGNEENAGIHGGLDADVTHPPGPTPELVGLLGGATEQLHQQRAGDVETLGHRGVHLRVERRNPRA